MTGIVGIGECMLELTEEPDGRWRMGHAGDTWNMCLYLARMGLDTAYITALGTDEFSLRMRSGWADEGLDTSLVLTDPDRLPGLYAIRTDRQGERNFLYWRTHSAARRLFELDGVDAALDRAADADLLILSGITLALFDERGRDRIVQLCRSVRSRGGQLAFDPNYRARQWPDAAAARAAIDRLLPHVSIALPTFADEQILHGDRTPSATADRWRAAGAEEVIVKLGPEGCLAAVGSSRTPIPGHPVANPCDTTGAGDAFNAGYLAARQFGATPERAAAWGNRLAAEVVLHPGAILSRSRMPAWPGSGEPDTRSRTGPGGQPAVARECPTS